MGRAEANERGDVEMELALAVSLDLMGGRISREQAENWLEEDQAAHGRWHLMAVHNPQDEKMASIKDLEEKRRGLVRGRD